MPETGDRIARYEIRGQLGRGGMGVVYRAEDTRLQRPVALKFVPPEAPDDHRARLFNEAKAAGRIRHPNVCPVYDVDEVDGQAFIALALLDGVPLSKKLAAGALDIATALQIAIQVASGLGAAHELGIIHRDIKPGNILIGAGNHAWILDFGLALHPESLRLTAPGETTGTPVYMSPEQVRGESLDGGTDVWSLGVVLFEMLTGTLPFRGSNHIAVMHGILNGEAPSVRTLRPDAPERLSAAVARALSRDRSKRWKSARAFGDELRAIAGETGVRPTTTIAVAAPNSRRKNLWLAGAAGALALMAGGAWWYGVGPRPSQSAVALPARGAAKQIAVLPFQIASGGERVRAVADGLTELLTESFSGSGGGGQPLIAVPSREIRRREITTPEDARRVYGVDYAVAGVAEDSGSKVRFRLRALDSAAGTELGAVTFDYDPAHAQRDRDRAVAELAKLLRRDAPAPVHPPAGGTDAFAAYLEGRGFLARFDAPNSGNVDKAMAAFARATDADPKFALAWAGHAEACWRKSRVTGDKEVAAQALASAERAVQLGPDLALTHAVLGTVYSSAGKQNEAISELNRALEISPENADAARELARLYGSMGRRTEAEAQHLASIRARPTDWYGYLLLGLFSSAGEQYKQAEAAFRAAAEMAPGNEIALRNLGGLYMIQGRYPEAVEVLQRSLKNGQNARTYYALGATYYLMHRFAEAAAAAETAADLSPGRHDHWGNLGIYYRHIPGSEARSEAALRKAVQLAEKLVEVTPNDSNVRADLAEYKARLGDARGALAEIDRIPEGDRQLVASRLALAFELTGNRTRAIEFLASTVHNAATLSQIRDDPDLAALWADPRFQQAIRRSLTK